MFAVINEMTPGREDETAHLGALKPSSGKATGGDMKNDKEGREKRPWGRQGERLPAQASIVCA